MIKWILSLTTLAFAILLGLVWVGFFDKEQTAPLLQPRWWGRTKNKKDDDISVNEFSINISTDVLTDLKVRLSQSRIGESLDGGTFWYGFQAQYLKDVVLPYWLTKYDWRKQEKELNKYQHYRTKIDGIDIHFVWVKPTKGNNGNAKPLLLLHGWPGSFYEFYKIIPSLTNPYREDLNIFELIIPSIPGYGFSEAAYQPGLDTVEVSRVFLQLMLRLNYEQFYVQGGDWGSVIGTTMAQAYPRHILGLHINMATPPMNVPSIMLKQFVGIWFPSLVLRSDEIWKMYPMTAIYSDLLMETGYLHIQASKPDTIGIALNDSPIGLAAYIFEKFSTWTNKTYRELPDGGLTRHFSMDELLTNVMIYWTTGTITSSMRLYKETFCGENLRLFDNVPVLVPSSIAAFPGELALLPESLARYRFRHLLQYTDMPKGGHFAAFEEPDLFVRDLRIFIKKVNDTK